MLIGSAIVQHCSDIQSSISFEQSNLFPREKNSDQTVASLNILTQVPSSEFVQSAFLK